MVEALNYSFREDGGGIITSDNPPFQVFFTGEVTSAVIYRDPVFPAGIKLWAAKGLGGVSDLGPPNARSALPVAVTTRNLQRDISRAPNLPPNTDIPACARIIQERIQAAMKWAGFAQISFIGKGSANPGMSYLKTPLYKLRLLVIAATLVVSVVVHAFAPSLTRAAVFTLIILIAVIWIFADIRHRRSVHRQRMGRND